MLISKDGETEVKNLPVMQETHVGSGRSPSKGNGNPLQYACLGNPMDKGTQWATVHGVARESHTLATKPPSVAQRYRICLKCRTPGFDPWVEKIPWRRKWQPIPFSILAWRIPWTEEPGTLQFMGSQKSWT